MTEEYTFPVTLIKNNRDKVGRFISTIDLKKNFKYIIYGELGDSFEENVSLDKLSHSVYNFDINEETGTVTGTLKLYDTPQGRIAKLIIENGGRLDTNLVYTGYVDGDVVTGFKLLKINLDSMEK